MPSAYSFSSKLAKRK